MKTRKKTLTTAEIVSRLQSLANPENVAGMKRFAVGGKHTLGISVNTLRRLAREIVRNHQTAADLWATGIHEARILASIIDDPTQVTENQMEEWVSGFDSWDITDQVCMNLFDKTPFAWNKAIEWASREGEFQKRAGFALVACLAWHDKKAPAEKYLPFLPVIENACGDGRNFFKKAISWALRKIGARDQSLNKLAVETAQRIQKQDSNSACWVARDVLSELQSEKVQQRLATAKRHNFR
ncbi:MAG: DNA alkylation repair protein [Chloroflexi bacterium]|nr:DNA alkylation repair protein [Chloroflexota bacterium]MBM3172335.1 DNA alkylation repair protein [Chloroflexota bacterium]MBM3175046.1 DNA alkylation repair protein [Chloroflexota bacterium]MBM4449917.1 DNA alkylation repair protein [Chloroflexota bacterium]